jgi:hypothetical protein
MIHDDVVGNAPALRTAGLGRRYGHVWGLRDCTLAVPAGAVAGLVGANGHCSNAADRPSAANRITHRSRNSCWTGSP